MSIFSADHPGVQLDATTLTNLELKEADLRGYFSTTQIRKLLDANPECVGIRFYNINPVIEFPALLAVCISAKGADLQKTGTHATCNPINRKDGNANELSREDAYVQIKNGYSLGVQESEKFSSFFSRAMLNHLEEGNEHDGLAFYKVIWLGGRSTHLAVSSDFDSEALGLPIIGLNGTGFTHCLSDQPCPGHCANMDVNGDDIVTPIPMASKKDDLQSHYIPIWD